MPRPSNAREQEISGTLKTIKLQLKPLDSIGWQASNLVDPQQCTDYFGAYRLRAGMRLKNKIEWLNLKAASVVALELFIRQRVTY